MSDLASGLAHVERHGMDRLDDIEDEASNLRARRDRAVSQLGDGELGRALLCPFQLR